MAKTQYFSSNNDSSIPIRVTNCSCLQKWTILILKLKGKILFSITITEFCVRDNVVEHLFLCWK